MNAACAISLGRLGVTTIRVVLTFMFGIATVPSVLAFGKENSTTGLVLVASNTHWAQNGSTAVAANGADPVKGCVDFTKPRLGPQPLAEGLGDEFVGPFASWSNLKTTFGAKGDGTSDDTAAVQAALDSLSTSTGRSPILFIPAGTYLIKRTVTVKAASGISVIGEYPVTTILKWAGANGGTLLHINGVAYSRFDRLTLDGSGTAGVVIDQSSVPNTPKAYFDTGNEYADDIIENGGIGIRAGANDGAAESSVLRDKFLNNTVAAIALKNFNALDWWVWYSDFENNAIGITNYANGLGAGNFHAYNNVFRNSTIADLTLLNTGQFNFRDNYSSGSSMFLNENFYYTNAATTRVQGNTIIMPSKRPDGNTAYVGNTIGQGNMGPIILSGNTFISPANAGSHPPVEVYGQYWPDCVSVNNTYTVTATMTCVGGSPTGVWSPSQHFVSVNDKVVSTSSISPMPPKLPGVPPNRNRAVVDVAPGSESSAIQEAINKASKLCGQGPVVHLAFGTYALTSGITIPADCNIQLVGDGNQTRLMWYGSGAALILKGPSRAILRDFYINAGKGTGIEVQAADQPGSRVYGQQLLVNRSTQANVFVDGLDYSDVEFDDAELAYTATAATTDGIALKVVGGPLAQAGKPQYGRTSIFAGSGGANAVTFEASKGATLLVRDFWYEGNNPSIYARISDNSSVTLEGSRMAVPRSGDSVDIDNLSCATYVLLNAPDAQVNVTGNGGGNVWVLGNNFSQASTWWKNSATSGTNLFNFNRRADPKEGSIAIPDASRVPSNASLLTALAQSDSTKPSEILDLRAGITDVRLYRVEVELGTFGVHVMR
jgi:Pectate lyase superfamily protein